MFNNSHPRVQYTACQYIGQLCTDLKAIIQDCFHRQLFAVLIPALKDPEPQVYVHTVLALINFCKGVERDTFLLYLEPIVEQLLKLLNPSSDQTQVRWYVQEQAITTLAMVADASEVTCGKSLQSAPPISLLPPNTHQPSHSALTLSTSASIANETPKTQQKHIKQR
uniref:Uncharacterized protein n=1 Tax=Psilocybe cubensis TaxID=181762 RepID=A0A8H7XX53_PSICU